MVKSHLFSDIRRMYARSRNDKTDFAFSTPLMACKKGEACVQCMAPSGKGTGLSVGQVGTKHYHCAAQNSREAGAFDTYEQVIAGDKEVLTLLQDLPGAIQCAGCLLKGLYNMKT